ncbi:hypothetical protein [Burkholderia ubonensis]|nr:hypothetical protein [Burkholderia ubonensis]
MRLEIAARHGFLAAEKRRSRWGMETMGLNSIRAARRDAWLLLLTH